MNKTPLVSIAMCTYNGSRFLKEQLDSILNQTYKNLEIIIVDDLSTDNTLEILKEYKEKDSRVKVFKNETNLGFTKNFEKSLSLCKGELIALADQDDIWKENKIELFCKNIQGHTLIYSDMIVIDQFGKSDGNQFIRPISNLVKGKNNLAFLFNNCVSGNSLMFDASLLKNKILPFPKEISYHDLWIAFVASSYGSITYTEEPMTYYRRYSEQITHKSRKSSNNIFKRAKIKKQYRIDQANYHFNNLLAFSQVEIIDNTTRAIIEASIKHFKNYNNKFYSKDLFNLLKKHKDTVFAIKLKHERKNSANKIARGLLYHAFKFYS